MHRIAILALTLLSTAYQGGLYDPCQEAQDVAMNSKDRWPRCSDSKKNADRISIVLSYASPVRCTQLDRVQDDDVEEVGVVAGARRSTASEARAPQDQRLGPVGREAQKFESRGHPRVRGRHASSEA
jgi:hypothetical protein